MRHKKPVVFILGPTASGKTALAVQLANRIRGEIISADSRQVYRGMDIGTGKDLSEYGSVPYHLIDIRPAGGEYSVSDFQRDAMSALSDISGRGLLPIVCGGTGHYIKSLLDDYQFNNPKTSLPYTRQLESLPRSSLYAKIKDLGLWDTHHWESDSTRRMARVIEKKTRTLQPAATEDRFRDRYLPLCFFIEIERQSLIAKIESRLRARLDSGLIEEVDGLLAGGLSHSRMERYGLEYRWVSRYLRGEVDRDSLERGLAVDIRRYAKRQMTFIRYLLKKGHHIDPVTRPADFPAQVESALKKQQLRP